MLLDCVDRDLIDMIIDVKRREKVAPATVNRYLALIRAVLRSAKLEWDWIDKVPRIRLLKEPTGRVRWITPEEAQRLLKELPTHLAAMARFSFSTGLRQGNVKRLRWSQVDMKGAKAWIDASQSKTGVAIPIPLNSDALAVLSAQIGKHKEFVFVYKGKPQNHIGTKAWYAAKERAGLSDFRWHDIRHTWASWHVQNGTPLHELMVLGGWRVYKTVLRYAHLSTNQLSDAANRIDGLMNTKE